MPTSDRWKEDVVEPTRRLDRMSWMLVSSALALAHELGVFGRGAPSSNPDYLAISSEADAYMELLQSRHRRLQSLLFVLVNLIAARIGCPSLLPEIPNISFPPGEDHDWVCFMSSWVDLTRLTKGMTEEYFPHLKSEQKPRRWNTASLGKWRNAVSNWLPQRAPCQRKDQIPFYGYSFLTFIRQII